MTGKLTDAKIKGLKSPESGQSEYSDSDVPGLRIRVGKSGIKTFILRKRVSGKLRNITVGRYGPRLGLAAARRKARQLISDIEAGKDVSPARREGSVLTIRAMLPQYIASKTRRRTVDETERIFRRYILPEFGDRIADMVTRAEVTKLIDEIATTAPAMARAVHAQLSAFYSWALPRLDRMQSNPCRDAGRPRKSPSRDRVLNDRELEALWKLASAEPLPWGAGLKLLILTGARREEVFAADRAEFDTVANEWTIPAVRSKNGLPHIIPLSPLALKVLATIPDHETSPKLFPTRTKANADDRGPSGFSKAQARIRQSLELAIAPDPVAHWTMHDIRRTVATGLQRLGVRFEVTEAVLNHVSGSRGGIAGVYQRHDWKAEKSDALLSWSQFLEKFHSG